MIGFEICINNHSMLTAIENGCMTLIVNAHNDRVVINSFGINCESLERIMWYKSELKFAQYSISIKVIEMEYNKISKPLSVSTPNDIELMEEYLNLKEKLHIKD